MILSDLRTLAAVHRLENFQIQNNEPEKLDEFIVHHRFVFFCDFHELTSLCIAGYIPDDCSSEFYSGIIFQPMRP
jgi:hypothetical protein